MLEVRPNDAGFVVYDTVADEAVIQFASRTEADELIAALQIQELHAQLKRWSADAVPGVW
ncbi:MAG: hypothetical protein WC736_16430 [Gallionella sp.]|jgi:hypothetical protein